MNNMKNVYIVYFGEDDSGNSTEWEDVKVFMSKKNANNFARKFRKTIAGGHKYWATIVEKIIEDAETL